MNALWDGMIQIVSELLGAVISLLPRSPFLNFIENFSLDSNLTLYLGWLNWFFPVRNIIVIFTAWIGAYTLFLLYSIILRWIKVIGD